MGNNRTIRQPYRNSEKKAYSDLEKFFIGPIIKFDKNTKDPEKLIEGQEAQSRVWLLFASNDNGKWDCVQVAHSKNEALSEIEFVLKYYKKDFDDSANITYKNSAFYEKVIPHVDGVKNREALYSKIGTEYKYFIICFLDVNKYLDIEDSGKESNDSQKILEICKNQYAEAKIAYEALAVYWRLVSSAIDGQTISYIVEHMDEF